MVNNMIIDVFGSSSSCNTVSVEYNVLPCELVKVWTIFMAESTLVYTIALGFLNFPRTLAQGL